MKRNAYASRYCSGFREMPLGSEVPKNFSSQNHPVIKVKVIPLSLRKPHCPFFEKHHYQTDREGRDKKWLCVLCALSGQLLALDVNNTIGPCAYTFSNEVVSIT
jgi:hypothetical protein